MKKFLFTVALCAFSAALFAAPAAENSEKVVLEGPFKIVKLSKPYKNLAGNDWVKGWGLAGTAGIENGKIAMKNGVMYGYYVSAGKEACKVIVTVKASAMKDAKKSVLNGYFSTCVREPGSKQPFRHEKRTHFGPFTLTAEEKEYKVEYDAVANENGYVYIGGTDLVMSSVRIVTKAAAK